jgi:serine phosphatase RsbU (regulator of sigma subunit)
MFGEDRLETLLSSLQGQTIHDTLDVVIKTVTNFRSEREISDDVTLLGVRRKTSKPL